MTNPMLAELDEVVRMAEKATPGPWLYRPKSNSWHKPPPEGTNYSYGEFILGMDSDSEDDGNGHDEAFLIAAVQFMSTHHAEIADMAKRLEALQSLAAAMYQAAGAYDMPARFLDVLAAAGNGEAITEEQVDALLPCETPDTLQRLEAAERKLSRLTGMRNEWERDAREHLMTFGQHLPASVECLVERFDAAIDATQEGEG